MRRLRIILAMFAAVLGILSSAVYAFDSVDDGEVSRSAYEENNDGDDVYVSNTGVRFRIPRITNRAERVFDYAGILSENVKSSLREKIAEQQERLKCDVVILTSSDVPEDADYGSETSQKYCRQFLIDNPFREDAFCFLIDLNNRVMWTAGGGRFAKQKYVKLSQIVYDACLPYAKEADYDSVAGVFIDKLSRVDNPLAAAVPTPMSLLISAGISFIGILLFVYNHRSSQPSVRNTPEIRVNQYKRKNHAEHYLGTVMTRHRISKGSGGGGGGGFSGGISSGGFSSGGGSFSGGGGKF